MVLVEIMLFAILLIAVVYFWVRLDMLDQQMKHLRAQLNRQLQRTDGASSVAPPMVTPSLATPSLGTSSATRRVADRPFLRLVKNR